MFPSHKISSSLIRRFGLGLFLPAVVAGVISPNRLQPATAQTVQRSPIQITADIQEYDAKSQVAIARGNVQMLYNARGIKATAAQAQFFNRERQIVLSGNVYILQQSGNSIRGERVIYLIDSGRFVAQPQSGRQVESIYIIEENNNTATAPAPKTPALKRK
ncbi:LptA/OstA family protein [Calothrix sp. UHCC 0171]|uniref:LptA/OstA family protein n=1 Tax=Calothrix sp. UHCC 0171 TaxID=3110245 RepID=UPI002B1F3F46|nr:LptA/OstA family protein [Calothrix sp. UHCC 0171]MEA5572447.1 LptA/OstA family protein [Calothrix sp. UHCC 0171]